MSLCEQINFALNSDGLNSEQINKANGYDVDIAIAASLKVTREIPVVSKENYFSAESRIKDSDVAEEVAALAKLQILQQAGASILAQANQQPQLTFSLLG